MHNHERDELQKRLKINADKQQARAAPQAKKPRHKILAEGLQFTNHAELQAHFSQHYLESLANANEKIRRVQGRVKKVGEKLQCLSPSSTSILKGLLQASFRPSGICRRELKGIWAKSVPSWMNCKLNCASLSFKPATSGIQSIMGPRVRTSWEVRSKVQIFWMSIICLWGKTPVKRLSSLGL